MYIIFLSFLATFTFALPVEIQNAQIRELGSETIELREFSKVRVPRLVPRPGAEIISCSFRNKDCRGSAVDLIPGIGAQVETVSLRYRESGKIKALTVALRPAGFPVLKLEGKSTIKNPLIFSTMSLNEEANRCHLFVLSPTGDLTFYRELDKVCFDFRPHRIEDRTFYSYLEVDETIPYVGYLGPRVILDENFTEINRVAPRNDMHEFLLLGQDHWIGIEVELARLSNGKTYFNKRIRERKQGKIIFDWGTSDVIAQFGTEAATAMMQTSFRGETVAEIFHFNSIQILKDGLLVGLGHDGVGYLNRTTKKLDWVLGGIHDTFDMNIYDAPLFNHTPRLDEKTGVLHVFSNRSMQKISRRSVRILSYEMDLKKKIVKKVNVLRKKDELSYLLGSVQETDGVLSIGFGSKESAPWDFIEQASDGNDVWKLALPKEWIVYRFYRQPD